MSDPAIDAAQRAHMRWYANGSYDLTPAAGRANHGKLAVESAREALEPIQAWYEKYAASFIDADRRMGELAKLIYSTEELGR